MGRWIGLLSGRETTDFVGKLCRTRDPVPLQGGMWGCLRPPSEEKGSLDWGGSFLSLKRVEGRRRRMSLGELPAGMSPAFIASGCPRMGWGGGSSHRWMKGWFSESGMGVEWFKAWGPNLALGHIWLSRHPYPRLNPDRMSSPALLL